MKSKKLLDTISGVALPVLFGVIIAVLWQTQVLHKLMGTDLITLPLLTRIGEIIVENFGTISGHIVITVIVALGGLVTGSVLGYLIAVTAALFTKWGAGGLTIVSAFNAIPIVALAPVINNWTRDVSNDVITPFTLSPRERIYSTVVTTALMVPSPESATTTEASPSAFIMSSRKITACSSFRIGQTMPPLPSTVRYSYAEAAFHFVHFHGAALKPCGKVRRICILIQIGEQHILAFTNARNSVDIACVAFGYALRAAQRSLVVSRIYPRLAQLLYYKSSNVGLADVGACRSNKQSLRHAYSPSESATRYPSSRVVRISFSIVIPCVVSISPDIAEFAPLVNSALPLSGKSPLPPASLICPFGIIKRNMATIRRISSSERTRLCSNGVFGMGLSIFTGTDLTPSSLAVSAMSTRSSIVSPSPIMPPLHTSSPAAFAAFIA